MQRKKPPHSQLKIILRELGLENNLIGVIVVFLLIGLMYSIMPKTVKYPPGILINEDPLQIETYMPELEYGDYKLRPIAYYSIKGRILDKNNSASGTPGRKFDLSGINAALGWKNMSDSAVLDNVTVRLSGRDLKVKVASGYDLPENQYIGQVSFNHLIPSNKDIEKRLNQLVKGDVIKVTGYLVEAKKDKDAWRSSTSRTDVGDNAAELIWVQDLQLIKFKTE